MYLSAKLSLFTIALGNSICPFALARPLFDLSPYGTGRRRGAFTTDCA